MRFLSRKTSNAILKILLKYSRIKDGKSVNTSVYNLFLNKILYLVEQRQVINLILPAFPAKSPNENKVLGKLPDLGEYKSLEVLNSLCESIKTLYPPGACVTICSDGHVFSDIVGVEDENVQDYLFRLGSMLSYYEFSNLVQFSLPDYFSDNDYTNMRSRLLEYYSKPLQTIKDLVKTNEDFRSTFNGIHKFIFEDYKFLMPNFSRKQIQKSSKNGTYQLLQRSDAWSNLVNDVFPEGIRLSIHPQNPQSHKLGVKLINSKSDWATPWHNAPAYFDNKIVLMPKTEALGKGFKITHTDDNLTYLCT